MIVVRLVIGTESDPDLSLLFIPSQHIFFDNLEFLSYVMIVGRTVSSVESARHWLAIQLESTNISC